MRAIWILLFLLLAPAALANDSTAVLEAGGLVYTSNGVIRIDRETLVISASEVKVDYDFTNTGETDITTLVAFPMPELSFEGDTPYAIDPPDPVNWMDFRVWVNGEAVRPKAELRARRFGIDVTAVLKRHGIPLIPLATSREGIDALNELLNGLDPEAREELIRHGLVDWSSQWGANNEALPSLHWTAHVAFYWFQTFPAGQTIHVAHRYRPVPGYSFVSRETLAAGDLATSFCVDDSFRAAFNRRLQRSGASLMQGAEISYILGTAANWLGPIGTFRLVIDKSDPDHLVSTCFSGLKPEGKTRFVFEQKDYQPDERIRLLVVSPLKDEAGAPQ